MDFTKNDLNKTIHVKPDYAEKNRKRYKVDATNQTLGRLAVDIAKKLMGKTKAHQNDFWDNGDFVVVENVGKVKITGNKLQQKIYYSYSGYKGNVKSTKLGDMINKKPDRVLWFAVRGMLPKNKLRDRRMKRLKLVTGTTDKYAHFKPVNLYNE